MATLWLPSWVNRDTNEGESNAIQLSHLDNWSEPERDPPSALYGWSPCSDVCMSVCLLHVWIYMYCTLVEKLFLYFSKHVYVYVCFTFEDSKLFICSFSNNCLHLWMGKSVCVYTYFSGNCALWLYTYVHGLRLPDSAVDEWRCVHTL